ncbi:cytosolic phospholipase A2 gamma-like [Arapaima gigas]
MIPSSFCVMEKIFSFYYSEHVHVHISEALNADEQTFVEGRKLIVEKCLKNKDIKYKKSHVPVIAVLGSGGGERATVGLLGCLAQLAEENLLDSVTYLCGVSGATWCMALLDEDPRWSLDLPKDLHQLVEKLLAEWSFEEILNWLSEAVEDENYSLTDFWAATVVYYITKQMNKQRLSEQKRRDATNPYPIYTVLDKKLKQHQQKTSPWFEISPHEAGYSYLGAFVDTEFFGSQFEAGNLKKNIKEMDMLYLQGLCGSALADEDNNNQYIYKWICEWIKTLWGLRSSRTELRLHDQNARVAVSEDPLEEALDDLIQLHDNYEDDDQNCALLLKLQKLQSGPVTERNM